MTRIISYPTVELSDDDLFVISRVGSPGKPTRNVKASEVKSFADNNFLSQVGLKFSWSTRDPLYRVVSTHLTNGIYSKLGVDFENLILEEGSTYKLIIERSRPASKRDQLNYRKGGFKRASSQVLPAPYTGRLSEVPITAVTGQKFDFKWDLFFRNDYFPKPAGLSSLNRQIGNSVKLHFAFRIEKTTGTEVTLSPHLGYLRLIGQSNEAPVNLKVVTFIP